MYDLSVMATTAPGTCVLECVFVCDIISLLCVCVCVLVCVCVCVCVCLHVYIYIYMSVYSCVCVFAQQGQRPA